MTISKTLSGAEVLARWKIHKWDLVKYVLNCGLTAYDTDTDEPIDIEEQKKRLEQRKYDPNIFTIMDWIHYDEGGVFFKEVDLEAFERNHFKGITDTPEGGLVAPPESPEDFILKMRSEGKSDAEIAYTLHYGAFKLSYFQLIREMGLFDKDTHRTNNAITQQGKRLCDAWEKTLNKKAEK